ncbi:MAG: hypothetical protein AAGJ35_03325 [Myxococcota bacterium]
MINASLILNIVVLIPVLALLRLNETRAAKVFGSDSPARRILSCMYLAIAVGSAVLLTLNWKAFPQAIVWSQALFGIQVFYKVCTLPAVGIRHPVVISNLLIAAFHTVTLYTS